MASKMYCNHSELNVMNKAAQNMPVLLAVLFFLVACTSGPAKKTDSGMRFLLSTKESFREGEAPFSDTLFHKSSIVKDDSGRAYVYVGNPGCSICIAKALDCYKSYLASGAASPFQFILKSEDADVFEYYLMQSGLPKPRIEKNYFCADLQDALYVVSGELVVSTIRW